MTNQKTEKAAGKKGGAQAPPHSREAKRMATVILETLSGMRTPTEAAEALGMAASRYYVMETRALDGLIAACEPRPRGPGSSPEKEMEQLRGEVRKQRQECERYKSLHRMSQRSVGIPAPGPRGKETGRKRRKRKPVVRALRVIDRLKENTDAPTMDTAPRGQTPQGQTSPLVEGR